MEKKKFKRPTKEEVEKFNKEREVADREGYCIDPWWAFVKPDEWEEEEEE